MTSRQMGQACFIACFFFFFRCMYVSRVIVVAKLTSSATITTESLFDANETLNIALHATPWKKPTHRSWYPPATSGLAAGQAYLAILIHRWWVWGRVIGRLTLSAQTPSLDHWISNSMLVGESLWHRLRDGDIVAAAVDHPWSNKYYFDRFLKSAGMSQTEIRTRRTISGLDEHQFIGVAEVGSLAVSYLKIYFARGRLMRQRTTKEDPLIPLFNTSSISLHKRDALCEKKTKRRRIYLSFQFIY